MALIPLFHIAFIHAYEDVDLIEGLDHDPDVDITLSKGGEQLSLRVPIRFDMLRPTVAISARLGMYLISSGSAFSFISAMISYRQLCTYFSCTIIPMESMPVGEVLHAYAIFLKDGEYPSAEAHALRHMAFGYIKGTEALLAGYAGDGHVPCLGRYSIKYDGTLVLRMVGIEYIYGDVGLLDREDRILMKHTGTPCRRAHEALHR